MRIIVMNNAGGAIFQILDGAKDLAELGEFMVTKLTTLQHIGSTHSTFMIGEVKNTTAFTV